MASSSRPRGGVGKRRARGVALLLGFVALLVLQWPKAHPSFAAPQPRPFGAGAQKLAQLSVAQLQSLSWAPPGGLALAALPSAYELPPLGYTYDALEPIIDRETMMVHHDKHHATYVSALNGALEGQDQPPLLDLIRGAIMSGKRPYRNAGGGVWNHNFFWLVMAPPGKGGEPSERLRAAIDESFGSLEGLKETFATGAAPAALVGSGWAWVIVKDGRLEFTTTPNQDNPLMEGVGGLEGIPILGNDVWEHAYYLKYQNRRPEYLAAWWDVVNWNQVNRWYEDALQGRPPIVDAPAAASRLSPH